MTKEGSLVLSIVLAALWVAFFFFSPMSGLAGLLVGVSVGVLSAGIAFILFERLSS